MTGKKNTTIIIVIFVPETEVSRFLGNYILPLEERNVNLPPSIKNLRPGAPSGATANIGYGQPNINVLFSPDLTNSRKYITFRHGGGHYLSPRP